MPVSDIIEKKKQKLERLKRVIQKQDGLIKLKQRKDRTRQLIEWGGLIVKAGLDQYDANILLGALLDIKEQINNNINLLEKWQQQGGAAFNLEKNSKQAVIVSLAQAASPELKLSLRDAGLRWNSIRQEWQGYTNLKKVKQLLQDMDAKIEEVNLNDSL